jgi:hypothetical protein
MLKTTAITRQRGHRAAARDYSFSLMAFAISIFSLAARMRTDPELRFSRFEMSVGAVPRSRHLPQQIVLFGCPSNIAPDRPGHFSFAFACLTELFPRLGASAHFKETPNRMAVLATDSGDRPSSFATASTDFRDFVSCRKRRSFANEFI